MKKKVYFTIATLIVAMLLAVFITYRKSNEHKVQMEYYYDKEENGVLVLMPSDYYGDYALNLGRYMAVSDYLVDAIDNDYGQIKIYNVFLDEEYFNHCTKEYRQSIADEISDILEDEENGNERMMELVQKVLLEYRECQEEIEE